MSVPPNVALEDQLCGVGFFCSSKRTIVEGQCRKAWFVLWCTWRARLVRVLPGNPRHLWLAGEGVEASGIADRKLTDEAIYLF